MRWHVLMVVCVLLAVGMVVSYIAGSARERVSVAESHDAELLEIGRDLVGALLSAITDAGGKDISYPDVRRVVAILKQAEQSQADIRSLTFALKHYSHGKEYGAMILTNGYDVEFGSEINIERE